MATITVEKEEMATGVGKNVLTARVTIRGIKPILWHWFGPDAIPLEKGEKTGVAGNDPEEWKKTVLCTKTHQLYVTASQVFGMVRDAAQHTKKGRRSIMADVAATLEVVEDRILLDRSLPDGLNSLPTDPEELVYLDIRSVVNPATKGRNVRYRVAASPGWRATFHLQWDKTIVNRTQMEAVVNDAGQLLGLGNGRVMRNGKGIGMGRFVVESFEYVEGNDA